MKNLFDSKVKITLELKRYMLDKILENKKVFEDTGSMKIEVPNYLLAGFDITKWINSVKCDVSIEQNYLNNSHIIRFRKVY